MFNHVATNPGAAGCKNKASFVAIRRDQWIGFDGTPSTTVASIDIPFNKLSSGFGLTLNDDRLGFDNNFQLKLAYAYRKPFWGGELGIGMELGFYNKSLEVSKWKTPDGRTPTLDDAIPFKSDRGMALELGFGLFYSRSDLYIGISSSHLHAPDINFENDPPQLKRHYFLTAGYNIQLPFPLFELQPSIFVKTDASSTQFSINANVLYNKKIWGGVSYRNMDALIVLIGFELYYGIKFGVAYDIGLTKLSSKIQEGSYEILLNYEFTLDFGKKYQKYKSVRFL
jgi:type IX secretion system PorP/SprF family membrane protein